MQKVIALFLSLVVSLNAFVPHVNKVASLASKSMSTQDLSKAAAAFVPAALISSPAFAGDIVELPSQTLALEVQFGAYLAVLLGTFLPVLFLINLYIQTESRKAGKAGGQDSE
uniref:Photosystem II reaction center M protein n=1 Tax=Triparma pacifica TaxID=91992 RepID=A0A7S2VVG9_9STRA